MELESADGAIVRLRPVRYQFAGSESTGAGRDWDANWLIIHGDIRTADSGSWSFADPCLTTWEARSVSAWLRAAASAAAPPSGRSDRHAMPPAAFTEPNLKLTLQDGTLTEAVISVRFSLESLPPWIRRGSAAARGGYVVALSVPHGKLTRAADDWDREIAEFPER